MKILLAVDGSDAAARAVDSVRERPWPPESTVRVLTVVKDVLTALPAAGWAAPGVPVMAPPDLSAGKGYLEARDWLRKQADVTVEAAAQSLRRADLQVDTSVRYGDAASEIIDEAEQWGADLIVLGSRGLSTIKRWLLGSTAAAVMHHAPCSVEVVRSRSSSG